MQNPWQDLLRVARAVEIRAPLAPDVRAALGPLPPETARFAPPRLASFVAGRGAALLALRRLGREAPCLAIGPRGAPSWPSGVVGSITHDGDVAAAAVAPAAELRGVGIDTQAIAREDAGTTALVADARELGLVSRCPPDASFTLVFSAKETLYKCLAPTVGAFFGFEDARVVLQDERVVRLRLERALADGCAAGSTFDVAWSARSGRVRTALEWTA